MVKKIYLACPYTDPSAYVMAVREELASAATAMLIEITGAAVYSPITHGHRIASHLPDHLRRDSDFWLNQCFPFLRACDMMLVLDLPGIERSNGVQKEIKAADEMRLPTYRINFHSLKEVYNAGHEPGTTGCPSTDYLFSRLPAELFSFDWLRRHWKDIHNQKPGGQSEGEIHLHRPDEQGYEGSAG